MNTKRIISIVLVVILVGVWGAIIYRVVDGVSSNGDGIDRAANDDISSMITSVRYVYIADVKDPFLVVPPVQPKSPHDSSASRKKKVITPPAPPPFTLNGIVFNATRRVAILQSADGSVYFLSEKDTLGGVFISKIYPKKVSYIYHSEKMFWQIE